MTIVTCPHCLARHERASGVDTTALPRDGDRAVCIKCGHWSIFDSTAEGGLRPPTPAELHKMIENPAVRAVELAWCYANRNHSSHRPPGKGP